jgi:predicted nucleic acid-binding protein
MMPIRIFIDTSAFLALEDESDEHHKEAILFRDQELLRGNYEFITTSYILDETLTLIRRRLGIPASIDFSKKVRKSQVVKVLSVSGEVEEKALDLFEKYDDKTFRFLQP